MTESQRTRMRRRADRLCAFARRGIYGARTPRQRMLDADVVTFDLDYYASRPGSSERQAGRRRLVWTRSRRSAPKSPNSSSSWMRRTGAHAAPTSTLIVRPRSLCLQLRSCDVEGSAAAERPTQRFDLDLPLTPLPAQSLPTLFPITTRNDGHWRAMAVTHSNAAPARMAW